MAKNEQLNRHGEARRVTHCNAASGSIWSPGTGAKKFSQLPLAGLTVPHIDKQFCCDLKQCQK